MVHIKFKFVVEDVDRHGNVRLYFRKKGHPKIRLKGLPASDEFQSAYASALAMSKMNTSPGKLLTRERGTLGWLCAQYYQSADFKRLNPRTQHVRRLILEGLCNKGAGPLPFDKLTPLTILKWRDSKADRPESANGLIKALRQLYSFAIEYRHAAKNPAKEVRYLQNHSEGHHSWTEEEIAQYEDHHPVGTSARLALALLLYTGQRRSDVVLFGPHQLKANTLHFTQQKNRIRKPVTLTIPAHTELLSIVRSTPKGSSTFLVTEFGKPFTGNGFGNRFRKWCDEAGLPANCSAHGLRKSAAARLAEAGATELEIRAITGHQTSREVGRYTKAASQKVLARSGFEKLYANRHGQAGNKSVPLSTNQSVPPPKKDEKTDVIDEDGAQGRNRTSDTRIFNPLLYQLSYLGTLRQQLSAGRKRNAASL